MNFWARSEIYSPALVRLLARKKGGRPLTWIEICDQSIILTPPQVEAFSQATKWHDIPLAEMRAYLEGCGLDFCNWSQCHRADEYLKSRPNFEHLRKSSDWKTYWLPLLIRWRRSHGSVTKTSDIWPPLRDLLIRLTLIAK